LNFTILNDITIRKWIVAEQSKPTHLYKPTMWREWKFLS